MRRTTKPTSTSAALNHYECATDHLLPMEMVCYRADSSGNLNPLFKRKYERHWWTTGFVPGVLKNFLNRSGDCCRGQSYLRYPEMAKIVGDTFKANKFKEIDPSKHNIYNPDTYYVNGCDVVFTWRYIQSKKDVIILKPTTTTTTAPRLRLRLPSPQAHKTGCHGNIIALNDDFIIITNC